MMMISDPVTPLARPWRLLFVLALCGYALTLAVVLFGPFQGAERRVGMSDGTAHMAAFYVLTVLTMFALPNRRKLDIVIAVALAALLTEAVQALVGRSASWRDLVSDAIGIGAAVLPLYVQDIRRLGLSSHRSAPKMDKP